MCEGGGEPARVMASSRTERRTEPRYRPKRARAHGRSETLADTGSRSTLETELLDRTPSWQLYRDLLDRAQRPAAWSEVAHWALDVLAEELGDAWPQKAAQAERRDREPLPLVAGLWRLGSHTLALAETVEWALRLRLLARARGFADLRRDLVRDVTAGRILHTSLQLEVAGLATRYGWDVQFEPALPGTSRPADLLIVHPRRRMVVETRVLTEAREERARRTWIDGVVHRLTILAAAHRTWLEGELTESLDDATVRELERWIPVEALAARAGLKPELRAGAANVRLVKQKESTGQLIAPGPSSNLWPRLASAIADKAGRMSESGAEWLRLIPYNHFFLLTRWAQYTMTDKLDTLTQEIRTSLGDQTPGGIIFSSGASLHGGDVHEETVRTPQGVALRRGLKPLRARETIIIPLRGDSTEEIEAWVSLADAETDWLPWALAEAGLPALDRIMSAPRAGPD